MLKRRITIFILALFVITTMMSAVSFADSQNADQVKKISKDDSRFKVRPSDEELLSKLISEEKAKFKLTNKEILDLYYKGYKFEAIFMARDAYIVSKTQSLEELLNYYNEQLKNKEYWEGYNEEWIQLLTECKDWDEVNKKLEERSVTIPDDPKEKEKKLQELREKYDREHPDKAPKNNVVK